MMTCATSLRNVEPGIRLLPAPEGEAAAIVDEPPFQPPVASNDADASGGTGTQGAAEPAGDEPAAASGESGA